jgi:hypothetical protein
MFHHNCLLAMKPASTPWGPITQTWRDSLPIDMFLSAVWRDSLPTDMLLSAVSALVVALPSLEVLEGLTN